MHAQTTAFFVFPGQSPPLLQVCRAPSVHRHRHRQFVATATSPTVVLLPHNVVSTARWQFLLAYCCDGWLCPFFAALLLSSVVDNGIYISAILRTHWIHWKHPMSSSLTPPCFCAMRGSCAHIDLTVDTSPAHSLCVHCLGAASAMNC